MRHQRDSSGKTRDCTSALQGLGEGVPSRYVSVAQPLRTGLMETYFITALVVGLAEVGDKSLFLALLLTARGHRAWPVFWGLLVGITLNLGLAVVLGEWLHDWIAGPALGIVLGLTFLAMAIWSLLEPPAQALERAPVDRGIFWSAALGFFLLEMADKTQLATVGLTLRFTPVELVWLGAVSGVVAVNAPAIWLGQRFARRLPVQLLHRLATALFFLLALWFLLEAMAA